MSKIAVMGDKQSVFAYACIGIDVFTVTDQTEGAHLLRDLAQSGYAIVYITEPLAALLEKEIDKYTDCIKPAVVLIPAVSGNTGAGMRAISRNVERAVGSDILSEQ